MTGRQGFSYVSFNTFCVCLCLSGFLMQFLLFLTVFSLDSFYYLQKYPPCLDSLQSCNKIQYMRKTLTISLPEEIDRGLSALVKRTGKSRSHVVQESLRKQIALERFRDLRDRLVSKGRRAGMATDEDVYKAIS